MSTLLSSKTARKQVTIALLLLLATACRGDDPAGGYPDLRVVALTALGAVSTLGDDVSQPDGLLFRVRDAAIVGDTVAVLDADPPFVKLFTTEGDYVGSTVSRGGGPGEARRPIGLAANSGRLLLVEAGSLSVLALGAEANSRVTRMSQDGKRSFRGAVFGCGDDVLALSTEPTFEAPGALTLERIGGPHDTVYVLGSIRANSLAHPFFAHYKDGSIIVFTEEAAHARLLLLNCHRAAATIIPIDSLGRQQWFEETPSGYSLHPAEPPHPAGAVLTGEGVIWATQIRRRSDSSLDSLTLFTLIRNGSAERQRVAIEGWYQLLDADPRGRLLLSVAKPVAAIVIISEKALLRSLAGQPLSGS